MVVFLNRQSAEPEPGAFGGGSLVFYEPDADPARKDLGYAPAVEPGLLVFEIGDWILEYRQEKTGGFINDHQPDGPGYTTALYLEGVGAAVPLASAFGDSARRERYSAAVARGFRFLEQLVIQQRDAPVLPNTSTAVGGLRQSLHRSEVRIDFVQHALSALLEVLPAGR